MRLRFYRGPGRTQPTPPSLLATLLGSADPLSGQRFVHHDPAEVFPASTGPPSRSSAPPVIGDPKTLAERRNIWDMHQLQHYPSCVQDVVGLVKLPLDADYGRIDVFHKAAQRRQPIHQVRYEAVASSRPVYPKGSQWWIDWSRPIQLDPDGNRHFALAFENDTTYAVPFAAPDKSSASFVAAAKNLELTLRWLRPDATLLSIRGDFDASWQTPGRPDALDRLPAVVREYVLSRPHLSITPVAPYSPELNRAEPLMGRVQAFAFANAIRAGLDYGAVTSRIRKTTRRPRGHESSPYLPARALSLPHRS
jgi:hypothetical protein